MLAVELLDELVYGANEAAWPLIRDDLALSYAQIGILLSVPRIVASLIEPVFGILADTWRRRIIILSGGVAFALSLGIVSQSTTFLILLLAYCILGTASGAFVSISQAALMDADTRRHEQNMARWTFAGSIGVVAGPLILGAATFLGYSWRDLYLGFALLAVVILLWAWRFPFHPPPVTSPDAEDEYLGLRKGLRLAWQAVRRREVLRWLTLLEFSDLMLDVLLGFLALYFVDVAGFTPAQASLGVAVWTGMGLLGDFLLIPLLERVPGLVYLRASTVIELVLFTGFLLVEPAGIKLVLVGLLGFFNSGWYAILRARLYSVMPGMSGTSVAVSNLSGLVGSLLPLCMGWIAQAYGLQASMWLLLLGPLALFIGLPRRQQADPSASASKG
jgi:FSR family fosmidomycin resistance protein-like MFS transporter